MATDKKLQGEGNYDAARRYDEAQKRFVQSGRVKKAAQEAAPKSDEEARSMKQAEEAGKSHSKGEDPSIVRPVGGKPRKQK